MAAPLPSQDELRRRLRAARVLRDLTVAELAALVNPEAGLGERTLRKLESGETKLRTPILRELAVALEFPYGWFTVAKIEDQFTPSAEWIDRLARVEAHLAAYEQAPPESDANGGGQPSPAGSRPASGRRGPRGTRQARAQ